MLRCIIRWLSRQTRTPVTPAPPRRLEEVIAQTAADGDIDCFSTICRALIERGLASPTPTAAENELHDRFVERLSRQDAEILRQFRLGADYCDIAKLMKLDAEVVRGSLVKTYADLRMLIGPRPHPSGGGQPAEAPAKEKVA